MIGLTEKLTLVIVATVIGGLSTWLAMRVARRIGFVNHPNPIVPQHTEPVAYLGGVGIALGAVVTVLMAMTIMPGDAWTGIAGMLPRSLLIGGTWFLALGLIDDVRTLRPLTKLILQVIGGTITLAFAPIPVFTHSPMVDAALALFWYVAVINAVNFTDVCDGLVTGLSAVTLLACGFMGLLMHPGLEIAAVILAGASLGCLVFNHPPARIFLGDAGSHLLGLAIADITLRHAAIRPAWIGAGVMVLLCAVPVFELVFITAMRIRRGVPWWRGSPDHFSLRMQAAGYGTWQVDGFAWSVAALGCAAAWWLPRLPAPAAAGLLAACVLLAALAWRRLSRWEVE